MTDEHTPDSRPARAPRPLLAGTLGPLHVVLVLLGLVGASLAVAGGALRGAEFAGLCLAAIVCERATRRNRLLLELAAGVGFVLVEALGGRVGRNNAWLEALAATAVFTTVRASSRLGDERRALDDDLRTARTRAAGTERDRQLSGELARRGTAPVAYELERARRHERPLAVLVVVPDSDASDRDAALEVANRIAASVRLSDIPAGVEGDGFLVLLPETGALEARIVAERVRLDVVGDHTSSVSVGISGYPGDASDDSELVAAAQAAAARARELGGNRTILYSIPPGYPAGWGLEPPLTRSA